MIMRKLIFLTILITSIGYSQSINGVYKSNFTSFINATDSSKNFSNDLGHIIVVDIYDAPYPNGSVSVTSSNNNESVTTKFVVKSEKKYHYEGGNTYLYYDGVISLMGVETSSECTIAFDVKVETLIIVFKGNNTQVWELTKI
jgi:hypothetical protein